MVARRCHGFGAILVGFAVLPGTALAQVEYRLQEQVSIGTLEGPAALSLIGRVFVADGRIYVGQVQENTVRVFSASGSFVGSIGRRGSGPGEFQSVGGIGITDGHLWISDFVPQRITIFDADHQVVRTFRLTGDDPAVYRTSFAGILQDGTMLATPTGSGRLNRPLRVLQFDSAGVYTGSPFSLFQQAWELVLPLPGRDNMATFVPQPLIPAPRLSVAPRGEFFAGVGVRNSGGRDEPVLLIGRSGREGVVDVNFPEWTRQRHDASAVDRARARLEQTLLSAGWSAGEARRAARDSVRVPDEAGYSNLIAGDDGMIWVRPAASSGATIRWAAYDARAGRWGFLMLPENETIRYSGDGLLVTARRGEYDVPAVVIYRLIRP